MKIAVFTDTYLPQINGVVVYLVDSLRRMSKDNEVVLFAPGQGPLRVEQQARNLKIYWVPSAPFPFYEGYRIATFDYRKVSAILKQEKPDVVHAHAPINLGLQGIISARRKRIPTVITYHTHFPDYVPHLLNGKLPGPLRKLSEYTAKKFVKYAFRNADVVTAPTQELAKELRSYGLDNVVCLPNGIEFKRFKRDAKREAGFRRAHRLTGKKVVLYVGRISFEKKLDVLLEAFRMIQDGRRALVVVGSGPYLRRFQELAKDLGINNAVFTGFIKQEELSAAYGCAAVFASASDTETFGLTFVEAMHMGLPVVGVRRFGAKEVIKDGTSGLLVEPGDTAGLAHAMERLLSDAKLRKRMGIEARRRAEGYSVSKSVEKTLEIYRHLL